MLNDPVWHIVPPLPASAVGSVSKLRVILSEAETPQGLTVVAVIVRVIGIPLLISAAPGV